MRKRKKIVSRLLCAALITATLPIGTPEVYAAGEAAEPGKAAYADKAGLQENYSCIVSSAQKVFFGKKSGDEQQAWKIVGKDTGIAGDNIVLFADSAIGRKVNFFKGTGDIAADNTIIYDSGTKPDSVNINHYGISNLRSVLKGMLRDSQGDMVTDYFTAAQQELMNETTITTNDTKNKDGNGKDRNYTTTDILYAAYGCSDYRYITVGTNNKNGDGNLMDGLGIDHSNWPKKDFWLRTPYNSDEMCAFLVHEAQGEWRVDEQRADNMSTSVVPAFDLNLTDVLFASSAPIAEAGAKNLSDGTYDTMTFRWADETGDDARIKSTATWNASGVKVTNNDNGKEVYLCVQGNNDKDWIWSQKVNEITSPITAQTIASDIKNPLSLTDAPAVDLSKCKVWFETTVENDGLTYAKEVREECSVNITAGTGLEITSDNATQTVNKGTDIGAITVTVDSNYYLPTNYISSMNSTADLLGSSGLTASETDTGFTISGKLTRDVTFQLPAATAKQTPEKPTLLKDNITRTKTSLIIKTDGFNTATYGPIQYRYKQASASDWTSWTEGTEISGLQAGTAYTIAIRYKGTDRYLPSDPATLTISTLEDTGNTDTDSSTEATTPDTDKTYDSNKGGDPGVTNTGNTGRQAGSKSNPEGSAVVQTGDESSPALWIALMLVALAAAGGTVIYGRRRKDVR